MAKLCLGFAPLLAGLVMPSHGCVEVGMYNFSKQASRSVCT